MGRVIRAGALALAAGLVVTPASGGPPEGNWTLEEAKKFRRYQLYDVPPSVVGLRLTAAVRDHHPRMPRFHEPPSDAVVFLYGDCKIDYTLEHPSCVLPLQIHVRPVCGTERLKDPRHTVRGVPARVWSRDHLGVWAGRVFVGIYAERPTLLWKVARSLRPVNRVDVAPRKTRDLPEPRAYRSNSLACSGK